MAGGGMVLQGCQDWGTNECCELAHLWVNRKESSLMWAIVTEMMGARKVEIGWG